MIFFGEELIAFETKNDDEFVICLIVGLKKILALSYDKFYETVLGALVLILLKYFIYEKMNLIDLSFMIVDFISYMFKLRNLRAYGALT